MARPQMNPLPYYMVIDITDMAQTKILQIARLREAQLWGSYHKLCGRTVVSPVMEGRGFAKLDKAFLQYLYWNTTGLTPSEDYQQLVIDCYNAVRWIAPDLTPVEQLEKMLADKQRELGVQQQQDAAEQQKIRQKSSPDKIPDKLSTCGYVWEIADRMTKEAGTMVERAALIAECEKESIHPSTAGTQYYRWKKSRLASS